MKDMVAARLDAFADAAFAFALTLLVIAGDGVPRDYSQLVEAMRNVPAFVIGFALIGMFWNGHVQWRRLVDETRPLDMVLTLVLVFLVLVYVYPLRLVAISMVDYVSGNQQSLILRRGDLGGLFMIYGFGFAAMCGTVAALFGTAYRRLPRIGNERAVAKGSLIIWAFIAASGLISALLASMTTTVWLAPFVYALLPVVIIPFAARYDWYKGAR